jgi:hypothetical protein
VIWLLVSVFGLWAIVIFVAVWKFGWRSRYKATSFRYSAFHSTLLGVFIGLFALVFAFPSLIRIWMILLIATFVGILVRD